MKFRVFGGILGGVLLLLQGANCFAYKASVHFYLTHSLGLWCGLDRYPYRDEMSEAFAIAWADYGTDLYRATSPGIRLEEWFDFSKLEIRKRFHFPVSAFGYTVVRASTASFRNVNRAFNNAKKNSPDPILFGIGLHTLQDSWAHEGYGPEIGHLGTVEPDYPHSDVRKAMEMAEATWAALRQWSNLVHGTDCRIHFNQIAGIIETWNGAYFNRADSLTEAWKKNAEAVAEKAIPLNDFFDHPTWRQRFHRAAAHILSPAATER